MFTPFATQPAKGTDQIEASARFPARVSIPVEIIHEPGPVEF